MSRRRIAVVSPFIDKRHGTERRVAEMVSRLADEYEFHIYSMRVEDIDLSRVVWHPVPGIRAPHLIAYMWWFLANHVLRWRDQRHGLVPDVIYSPGINCLDADAVSVHIVFGQFRRRAARALRLSQNPFAAWPRILHRRLYYRLIAALELLVYSRPGLYLAAVSNKIAGDLKKCCSVPGDIRVIYNGLDLECFSSQNRSRLRFGSRHALPIGDDQFVLLLIGNDWRNKGLKCLIEAMGKVPDSRLCALIVGNDDARPFLSLIARCGLKDRVKFCPPRPDVEAYYAAADAYVGPSLDDAFAQPPAEAMACGLPIITSRTNGGSEIITHGCNGLVLEDPMDSQMLARMISDLMSDPALCNRLGTAAAETARQYTWERNAAQMRDLFETAIRKRSAR
jgi:glycosyltransferase involved in cell wall biosynthesis